MQNNLQLSDPTYRIESEIGSGGGGVVYKAWHMRLQKHVILKELKRGVTHDTETQRNEVEALKNVKSAYLPQVFDFLTEGDRIFTVMEFVEGDSLDKLLKQGQTFSQQQVVKWYEQLASALESIHKQNVYHRDIKPANIMLTPSGDVCLIDFNAALVGGNNVRIISRSLGYASPEQYEIYEQYRKNSHSPINYGSSSVEISSPGNAQNNISDDYEKTESLWNNKTDSPENANTEILNDGNETELLSNDGKTEILSNDDIKTELLSRDDKTDIPVYETERLLGNQQQSGNIPYTEFVAPGAISGIDWKRSDIYSLGATMYHLLTGIYPSERASEVIPISKMGRFSEGIVYVIEQSMKINPLERFASATILSTAIRNIYKHDTRWKISQSKKIAALIILPIVFIMFLSTTLFGADVMAQEREERFYSLVHQIENGANPHESFALALDVFWDRIDPYYAMAKRLWNDGDIEATRAFIEENLGYIAKFQSVPEAAIRLGNIYAILARCFFDLPSGSNYHMARGYLEIAIKFVTHDPSIFHDYAIVLARMGDVAEAAEVLEKAERLGLTLDFLDNLRGEISFVKHEYESALESFGRVVFSTDNDDLRYRAFKSMDDIFKQLGQFGNSIALLHDAMGRVPSHRVPEMTERLAVAYFRNGNYHNAIALFEELVSSGPPQFHLMQGLADLLNNVGEYERAFAVLEQMLDFFPNDYRIPMRQAFFEIERQSRLDNELRDYALSFYFYVHATELYYANLRPGHTDAQMQQLSSIIQQLQAGGWLD